MNTSNVETVLTMIDLINKSGLGPLITPSEAAKFLRLKPATIHRALTSGQLEGTRLGSSSGPWRISVRALACYACVANDES